MKGQKGYAVAGVWSVGRLSIGAYPRLFWQQLKRWNQLAKQRHQLASLSDAALKDIGVSRADVSQETQRPFWDDPLQRSCK